MNTNCMDFNQKKWKIDRYPRTKNRSLRAWSAVDELILVETEKLHKEFKKITIFNDTYGALTCALNEQNPTTVIYLNSQLKAIKKNLETHKIPIENLKWTNPLKFNTSIDIGLIKIPKSIALFDFYLKNIHQSIKANSIILCGFMTRNFTENMITTANRYFDDVSQSLAKKKARLLILKQPKKDADNRLIFREIKNDLGLIIKQYPGVFSNKKIDFGTQLLLKSIPKINDDNIIMDLACGNGIIAAYLRKQNAKCNIHLVDDNFLAISSAKLNLSKEKTYFYWTNDLNIKINEQFDLITCNPPFHFEFENTIEIALSLFAKAKKYLKNNGIFLIVANKHLNYSKHLFKLFGYVEIINHNDKFEVISCSI